MKKVLLGIILLLILPTFVYADKTDVSFVKCVDGDTAVVKLNGYDTKIRFLAVDTPETKHPTKKEEKGGKVASTYTCDALKSAKKLEIEYDPKSDRTDKYGRTLVWLYVDGELFQKTLIKEGYAEVAYIYSKYQYVDELCKVQKEAIKNKVGIWADGTREEGYCKTKSNKKTTKKTTTKSAVDYLLEGKVDKAISKSFSDGDYLPLIVLLLIMLIGYAFFNSKKKK